MRYPDAMELLSQCELGAVLISEDNQILSISEAGDHLLYGGGNLVGTTMPESAVLLCRESDPVRYTNVAFGEYLCRCTTPELSNLPPDVRVVVFRLATNDAYYDMLVSMLNGINGAVILLDEQGHLYLLSDVAVNLDSTVTSDVLSKHVSEIYHLQDGSFLAVPQVIQDKHPKLNLRQYYTTCFRRNVDVVANISPIVQNGQTLSAYDVMEGWSTASELHKRIIDLQDGLLERSSTTKAKEKSASTAKHQFSDIIYISLVMGKMVTKCRRIAQSGSSVMIYGETRTGKELLAQSIHNAGRWANNPFITINCATIPDNLLEGLLFGTEKGAYTGAECRTGLSGQTNGGTLLLDEINSIDTFLQSKLPRVLQDGMIRRVGGAAEIHADVGVLSNINIPPYQAIEENKLRQDLFYRLGVINISIPPLHEHKEDIPLLPKSSIPGLDKELLKNVRNISSTASDLSHSYHRPGSIRELEHCIKHAMNILPDDLSLITPDYIPGRILNLAARAPPYEKIKIQENTGPLIRTTQNIELQMLRGALLENDGNISRTTHSLEVSRQNLQCHIKRSGMNVKALLSENDK